jgi:alpha-ketoglutarate-dependent taurine dioxygenase
MKVTPYSSNCGAVVSDLQLTTMSDTQLEQLRAAFTEYGLLFFRDQELPPAEHLRFANRFGKIVVNKFFKTTEESPLIAEVRKEKTPHWDLSWWHEHYPRPVAIRSSPTWQQHTTPSPKSLKNASEACAPCTPTPTSTARMVSTDSPI